MHFQLTEQQRMIPDLARDVAAREIIPVAPQHERDPKFPSAICDKARELSG